MRVMMTHLSCQLSGSKMHLKISLKSYHGKDGTSSARGADKQHSPPQLAICLRIASEKRKSLGARREEKEEGERRKVLDGIRVLDLKDSVEVREDVMRF